MASASSSLLKELNYCTGIPDSMSTKELFTLSLRQLSNSLPQTTSSHATLSIYLRWLEAHRQQPSKLTEHWQKPLLHRTPSLRSRGFLESEIIRTVDDWKEANGPFCSKNRRYLPTPKDICTAFDEMEKKDRGNEKDREESLAERLDRSLGDSYRPGATSIDYCDSSPRSKHDYDKSKRKKHKSENFEGKPPRNYVCNRCGHKGHHLQVCPTNMDPTYDKPPTDDYECEICKARGKHFKSLCPRNSDPHSIIQKRRRQGIEPPYSNKGTVFREKKKEVNHQRAVEGQFVRWREPNDGRLSKASSNVSTASTSPNPSLEDEKKARLKKIDDLKMGLVKGEYIVNIDELMAEGPFDEAGHNDRKRSRMHDQSDSSSRDASPSPSFGGPMQKRARMSHGNETKISPLGKTDLAESPVYPPRSNIDCPGDTIPCSADMVKTGDWPLKEAHDWDKERQEGEMEKRASRKEIGRNETLNCGTENDPYASAMGDDPSHMHRRSIRRPPEFLPKQGEQVEGAVRTNRVCTAPPPEERQSCPNSVEHKFNLDALSINISDTDTFEERELEVTPKQYSNFVQKLINTRPEMSEIINVVKKRPTAGDMWKIDDKRRMEQMTGNMPDLAEPTPPYSSIIFEGEESTPTSNTSEPSGAYARVFRSEYAQLDGASDENPADDNKVGQQKSSSSESKGGPRKSSSSENRASIHRRISKMGREAIEKVKELTNYAAEDLQALKSKASSPFRSSGQRTEELSPTKLRKKIAADTKIMGEGNLENSLNNLQVNAVNAAKSALSLTEERVKALAQSSATTVSHASENSFGSLEVNLPGDRPMTHRKPSTSNPFAQYAGRRSIETLQDANQTETMLQEKFAMADGEALTTSDATDLQSNEGQTNLAGKSRLLPEGSKSGGSCLSDVTKVGNF